MKRIILLVVVAAALAVPASGAAGPDRAATGSTTYTDSTGELAGGPDITTVNVANDNTGLITFTIAVPNRPSMTSAMGFLILLDTDRNPATGRVEESGADYAIDYEGGTADLGKWDGTQWNWDGPQTSLVSGYAGGATIKIAAADLGGTTAFNFYVAAVEGTDAESAAIDFAPDAGHGTWPYVVVIDPPQATPPAKPAKKPVAKKKPAVKKPAKKPAKKKP